MDADNQDVLGGLGVTARPAEDVESDLLAKLQASETVCKAMILNSEASKGFMAQAKRSVEQDEVAKGGWERKQRRIQKRLQSVQQELQAVQGALEALDTAAPDDAPQSKELQEDAGLAKGQDLQRAGLVQRLADLQAQEDRLQGALEAMLEQAEAAAGAGAPRSVEQEPQGLPAPAEQVDDGIEDGAGQGAHGLVETERDRLIRLGVLTPFDNLSGFERKVQSRPAPEASMPGQLSESSEDFRTVANQLAAAKAVRPRTQLVSFEEAPRREKGVRRIEERFWRQAASGNTKPTDKASQSTAGLSRSTKRKRAVLPKRKRLRRLKKAAKRRKRATADGELLDPLHDAEADAADVDDAAGSHHRRRRRNEAGSGSDFDPDESDGDASSSTSFSDDMDLEDDLLDEDDSSGISSDEDVMDLAGEWDDADDDLYEQRIARYEDSRRAARSAEDHEDDNQPSTSDVSFDGGYKIASDIYDRLFDYQQTGVKWLWELHTQRSGGIIGDEMGLGKTIQVAAFLAGLHRSKMFRPTLIVCPATVMRQWLRELRTWHPPFRVVILHESARASHRARPAFKYLVRLVSRTREGICVTSYEQLRRQRAHLINVSWGYVVLDEGHKIRNPDAEVTLAAKQLATVHRIIMTGSPIQNRLAELWSLFDFVFPGKLGTLPVFQTQFALPIQMGGYSNASAMQVSTAYKCAVVLRDLIAPYLLRRRKADVAKALPKRTEQVLFTMLGQEQRELYRSYLASQEVEDILEDRRNALAGIDILRKICNHPDLLQRAKWEGSDNYGNPQRSGKLVVALKVLEHWRRTGHRALLFTQTQQMLDIIEKAVSAQGLRYHRMDGSTAVGQRARLVDHFNADDSVFVFLLTTKVGGIGINLTGADRVMLYDPDWNPSTDMQARERAWRIGQRREVTIYRLITSGTIEEKVYHRQIYKQFLTNKVLSDPRQKRFFKSKDMRDLFTLGDQYADAPETADIFAGLDTAVALDPTELAVPAGSTTPTPEATPPPQDIAAGPGESAQQDGDASILRDLFEGTGIMGAMDHAKIEGANDPEARTADLAAAKVAKRAADELRKSRAARQLGWMPIQPFPAAQPPQQGSMNCRSGTGGAPSSTPPPPRRFGNIARASRETDPSQPPSSSRVPTAGAGLGAGRALRSEDLLARMRQRQAAAASDGADPELLRAGELSKRIVAFLASKGGSAPSAEVVSSFQEVVPQAELPLFRHVLQQVARLQRSATGGGKQWVLAPEFVPDS